MSSYSLDLLRGACLAAGVAIDGDASELQLRLGNHLVAKMLSPTRGGGGAAPGPKLSKKRRLPWEHDAAAANKRGATAWNTFMKSERPLVVRSGFTGRADTIRELARRWKIYKQRLSPHAPLMLPPPSSSASSSSESDSESTSSSSAPPAGLLAAIEELDEAELNAALSANGLPCDGSLTGKVNALARAMLA